MTAKRWVLSFLMGAAFAFSGPLIGKALSSTSVKNVHPEEYGKISKLEVFWMYTMKTRFWDSGMKVTVFYLPLSSALHRDFCLTNLNVTTDRFEKNIKTYINTGNASYFVQVDNEEDMIRRVSSTMGGIGYVSSDVVIVNRGDYVQKLRIVD